MIIKRIITAIVMFILFLSLSQTILLGSFFFNKNVEASIIVKEILMSVCSYIYTYGFDSKILYEGDYNKSDKVDIIISNHLNSIDFYIYLSIIKLYDDRPIYYLIRKNLVFLPGIGFIFGSGSDITLNRKLEDDVDNINDKISKIKEGIIIIMPEGTRYTPEKFTESQKYCKENGLTVFNNVLYPKMKGLYLISSILKKNNKLGKIIDFTIQFENFKNQKAYIDVLFTKKIGRSFGIVNSYDIPHNILDNYNDYKNWFISTIWIKKDLLLDNIDKTEQHNYTELVPYIKDYQYFIIITCITLFIYLITHMNGYYIPISLGLSYVLMAKNYNK
jgi:1-acyl-sn-glycerol-3-phosphate acyltransferase